MKMETAIGIMEKRMEATRQRRRRQYQHYEGQHAFYGYSSAVLNIRVVVTAWAVVQTVQNL